MCERDRAHAQVAVANLHRKTQMTSMLISACAPARVGDGWESWESSIAYCLAVDPIALTLFHTEGSNHEYDYMCSQSYHRAVVDRQNGAR
jgi:hypothetical protein